MSEGAPKLSQKQLDKLDSKANELGYTNLAYFVDDIDMLLRPAALLKQKDMKYFELENLISLLISKNISLGVAPRMISMVTKYSERNEELESENTKLKQEMITYRSKSQTAETQITELQKQIHNLSSSPQIDAKTREDNIKLNEENKYLKKTNESLENDLKKTIEKLELTTSKANDLEVENNQLELKVKDMQKLTKDYEYRINEEKKKGISEDSTKKRVEELINELDELYESIDDPFRKEFLAFIGVELSEIVDERHITKQKILNQISIHAREIEKIYEPKIAAMRQAQVTQIPSEITTTPIGKKEEVITTVVRTTGKIGKGIEKEVTKEPADIATEKKVGEVGEDRYVRPSEFLKGKAVDGSTKPMGKEGITETEEAAIEKPKPEVKQPVSYPKKTKLGKAEHVDRTPSPELIKVFDVFIKYLEAISDNNSFNDLCDKLIEELYEHVGSPGMTQVYKIKSGGVKRKQMLIDLVKQWKTKLPEL